MAYTCLTKIRLKNISLNNKRQGMNYLMRIKNFIYVNNVNMK